MSVAAINGIKKGVAALIGIFMLILVAVEDSDADGHKKEKHQDKSLKAVTNEPYKTECGACHFPYHPELLPSESWQKIINELPQHFGDQVLIDASSLKQITVYLTTNGAEKSSAKLSRKIIGSLGGNNPLRITDVPYIKQKHHDIPREVFSRKQVGSFSNCSACHTRAEQGNYDDDYVRIP